MCQLQLSKGIPPPNPLMTKNTDKHHPSSSKSVLPKEDGGGGSTCPSSELPSSTLQSSPQPQRSLSTIDRCEEGPPPPTNPPHHRWIAGFPSSCLPLVQPPRLDLLGQPDVTRACKLVATCAKSLVDCLITSPLPASKATRLPKSPPCPEVSRNGRIM